MTTEVLLNGLIRIEDRRSGLVALFNRDGSPRCSNARLPLFAPRIAEHLERQAQRRRPTELTPEGEQYVIPGCERRTTAAGTAPAQGSLF